LGSAGAKRLGPQGNAIAGANRIKPEFPTSQFSFSILPTGGDVAIEMIDPTLGRAR